MVSPLLCPLRWRVGRVGRGARIAARAASSPSDGSGSDAPTPPASATSNRDANALETALASAVRDQDYAAAARLRDMLHRMHTAEAAAEEAAAATGLANDGGECRAEGAEGGGGATPSPLPPPPSGGWASLGAPAWLADRLERLGFFLPTRIQRATCTAVLLQVHP